MLSRQAARALLGKTVTHDPDLVLDDGEHDSAEYCKSLCPKDPIHKNNITHELMTYNILRIAILFHFGHLQKAYDVAYPLLDKLGYLWTLRPKVMVRFYVAATLLKLRLDDPDRPNYEREMALVQNCKTEHIDCYRSACDANYGTWSRILEAMVNETTGVFQTAIRSYEAALDHALVHKWPIEESIILELKADFFIRSGAKTAARSLVNRAISSWNAIGASGKAKQLYDKHLLLLRMGPSNKIDAGTQTSDSLLGIPLRRSTGTLNSHRSATVPLERGSKDSSSNFSSDDTWGPHAATEVRNRPSTTNDAESPLDPGMSFKFTYLFRDT